MQSSCPMLTKFEKDSLFIARRALGTAEAEIVKSLMKAHASLEISLQGEDRDFWLAEIQRQNTELANNKLAWEVLWTIQTR